MFVCVLWNYFVEMKKKKRLNYEPSEQRFNVAVYSISESIEIWDKIWANYSFLGSLDEVKEERLWSEGC